MGVAINDQIDFSLMEYVEFELNIFLFGIYKYYIYKMISIICYLFLQFFVGADELFVE